MNDIFDPELVDEELEQEIRLVTDLMLLASETSAPLPQAAIDSTLGLPHR